MSLDFIYCFQLSKQFVYFNVCSFCILIIQNENAATSYALMLCTAGMHL